MGKNKWLAIVAAALVAGLVLGNLGSAAAASSSSPTTGTIGSRAVACGLGIGRSVRDAGGRIIDVVASLTGKTTAQVAAERSSGKSFSQIAKESNVTSAQVIDKTLAVRKTALDDAVKAGTITQAQADAALANMSARLTAGVDATGAGCGAGRGAGRGAGAGYGAGAGCGAGRGAGAAGCAMAVPVQ
jgi:hypothetical protein